MPSDLDSLPIPLYHSGTGALHVTCLAASGEASVVAPPPEGGITAFAVRSFLRTSLGGTAIITLQRCAGIALAMTAWIVMLAGLAHLCVAALHNRSGELGLGIDATVHGAQACLLSLALGAAGVPLWVLGELRLRRHRAVEPSVPV